MREPSVHRAGNRTVTAPVAFLTMSLAFIAATTAHGQNTANREPLSPVETQAPTATKLTPEEIAAELQSIESSPKIDDSQKALLKDMLMRAGVALEAAQTEEAQASKYAASATNTAAQTAALNASLDKKNESVNESVHEINDDATAESLSSRLATAQAELQSVSARSSTLSGEPARRRTRLTEIPGLIAESKQDLQDVVDQLGRSATANESPEQASAREIWLRARRQEIDATIDRLEKEQASYIATTELLPLEQKLVEQKIARLDKEIKLLKEAIVAIQAQKANETSAALKQTTASVPEALKSLAQQNEDLARIQSNLISESADLSREQDEVLDALDQVTAELQTSQERVKSVGLTDALGLMFRERKQEFDDLKFKYRPQEKLNQLTQQHQIESFRLEDELDAIKKELAESESPATDWESEEIDWKRLSDQDAEWILQRKRQKLIEDNLGKLSEVLQTMLVSDTQRRLLRIEIDGFNEFVDTHLFWTRSAPAISFAELDGAGSAAGWITHPKNWTATANQLFRTIAFRPLQSLSLVVILFATFFARGRFRRTIAAEGKNATRIDSTFQSTLYSLFATIGAAVAWPALFGVLCYLCVGTSNGNPFVLGAGNAFGIAGLFISSRLFLREICRGDGLAASHFGWSETIRNYLRQHLRWYIICGGIVIFILVLYHEHPDSLVRTFASRVTSTLLFAITAIFHHVMLRQRSPLYAELVRANPGSFIYQWRKPIWMACVGLPIVFGMMSLAGYLETTFRLGRSLQSTFFLLVIVILLLGLLSRWLTLNRRDIALRKAAEARQRKLSTVDASEQGPTANEAGIVLEDDNAMDLPTLDQQTRQLVFVLATGITIIGLAFIWSDLVPALAYLDEVELWSIGTKDNLEQVTLKDMIYACLSLAALLFTIRNLPSLLELLVLSRTGLDSGARYAISTLLRYAVIVIGVIAILNLLSLPYNQLGWLVAAISVGLGFGLQEIVANFVCGIILLLERPVRVGDVVTIDDTTGVVSRIQMRATTVTNWDRKELVIPNKDLITQKLLNWSLSNVVNRLTIEVGVAYGSNTDQVRKILHDVVAAHPDVMHDPPPLINFETFGDSSLNFVLRFYLPTLDNRIEVTHQINTKIAQELETKGISIPFPHRDVYLHHETPTTDNDG